MTQRYSETLSNDVALISGAGSGIGAALAQAFALEGAKVILTDLNLDAAEEQAKKIHSLGGSAIAFKMNVTDEREVDSVFSRAEEAYGAISIAVCNAGIQHIQPFHELHYADWTRVIRVNLDGAFLTAQNAYRRMVQSHTAGGIIFIGSVHSKEASLLKAPYVAAKHAIIGLSKVLAKEGAAHGIRSNVICPGFVKTPLVERQIPEQAAALGLTEAEVIQTVLLKDTIDGSFTTEDELCKTALFLASFKSGGISGQSIVVSHGWHLA